MFSKLIPVVAVIVALSQSSVGVDVCAYTTTLGCTDISLCCFNIAAAGCCSPLPTSFGFSISYSDLPVAAGGEAWSSSSCSSGGIRTFALGPGTRCWTGGGLHAASMRWNFGVTKRSGNGNCTAADVFTYPVGGETKAIRIPGNDNDRIAEIDKVVKLYQDKDFEALTAYEPVAKI